MFLQKFGSRSYLFIRAICLLFSGFLISVSASAQVNVLTQHNDNARTGQNTQETILTPANVNPNQFGKLFAMPVDGQVYAQPLYVSNLSIPGKGTHNVVFVVTEMDSVYAFDADRDTGANSAPLWKVSLIDAAHGAKAGEAPMQDVTCQNMIPGIGITSTPVIDLASGSIFVEAKSAVGNTYFERLHVLDILTGNERAPGPAVIGATVPGTGQGSSGGSLPFDAFHQFNRAGLLLSNGTIFIGFGSRCDLWPYHGWVFAYDPTTLQQKGAYATTPNGIGGGVWMAGAGLTADAAGNLYVPTGNGTFNQSGPLQLGDSIVKLALGNGNFSIADYFTPSDQDSLNTGDMDVGSGGVLLLPDQPGAHPHLLVQAGKEGRVYVIDRDQMTTNNQHYCGGCSADPEIVQESAGNEVGGVRGVAAFWNNTTYWWGSDDHLKAIPVANGALDFAHMTSANYSGYPGATPAISANGTVNGILWAIYSGAFGPPAPTGPAVLMAHDAGNIALELYNSSQAINNRDTAGNAVRFVVPTIASGKVYVGTTSEVDVYGLLNATPVAATPVISPVPGAYPNSVTVSLTDSMAHASIYYTTNGATPTTASTRYSGQFVLSSSATVKAIAAGTGYLNSQVASASYTIGTVPVPIMYEPESLPAISSGPPVQKLPYYRFTDGMGIFFNAAKVGDNITYKLNIAKPGIYNVKVAVKKFPNRGMWQLTVNGKSVGPFRDGYAASDAFAEFDLGNMTVTTAGDSNFEFIAVGRNSASKGYTMAFDYFKLTPQ